MRITALERDVRRLDAELEASVKEKEDLMKEKEDLRERLETSVAHAAKLSSEIEADTSSTIAAGTGVHPPTATAVAGARLRGSDVTLDDEGAVDRELKGKKKKDTWTDHHLVYFDIDFGTELEPYPNTPFTKYLFRSITNLPVKSRWR